MLSERQLRELLKVFDTRYQAIVEEYIQRMGEHLRDIGRLTDTDVHRLKQLKRMNANVEAIKKKIAQAAAASVEDIEQVFRHIAESNLDFANTMFAETHTPGVKVSPIKTLSSPMERILKAQLRITAQTMANLSQTTILSDGYKAAVDVAVQTVQSGLTDYNSAIRRALKEACRDGLMIESPKGPRAEYFSGHRRRLDTAVRQNVLDGMRALNQDTLDQLGKEFGADGVEISAHMLCAADHLPYQGLQFSNKEFERIQNTIERPFGMWNCKHTMHPILLGISEPSHTKEELEMYRNYSKEAVTIDDVTMSRYEWSQQQRRIETAVREQKHIAVGAKASGDDVARREAQRNINRLQTQYAKISDAAGLTPEKERMAVAGFRKVKTADELKNPAKYGIITEEERKTEAIRQKIKSGIVNKTVNHEKQNRHIKTSELYDGMRSYISGDLQDAQALVDKYHGTGDILFDRKGEWKNKELVLADADIGVDVDPKSGDGTPTNRFVIHYSKTGAHIVPTSRKE